MKSLVNMLRLSIVLAVLLTAVSLALPPAHGQQPFYKDKRLTILINFAPGGSTDTEGRLFARHIGRHIEGQPNVIVQNMEGAGGVIGAKYVGEVAPRDGTVVGYFTATAFISMLTPERFQPNFTSYQFIATQGGTTVHFIRSDVEPGMREAGDILRAKGVVIGGLSPEFAEGAAWAADLRHARSAARIYRCLPVRRSCQACFRAQRGQRLLGIAAELPGHHRARPRQDRQGDPTLLRCRL